MYTLPTLMGLTNQYSKTAVPSLFGTRDRFPGRQFYHGRGGMGGMTVQAVMRTMESDGERQ